MILLEIYATLSGRYACCEVDTNGEKYGFVYGNTKGEAIRKKGEKLEEKNVKWGENEEGKVLF